MNKRFTTLGLTAALVVGGAAGLAIGITRIAGASAEDPAAVAANTASTPAAVAAEPGSTVAEVPTSDVEKADDHGDDDADHEDGDGDERGRGPEGGRDPQRGRGPEGRIDAAATALGMTPDELSAALGSGQTLAAIAESKSVDPQTVIDAIVAAVTAHEQEEVASGDHTQAEVDARLAELSARVGAMVNGTPAAADADHDDDGGDDDGAGDRHDDDGES